MQGFISCVYMCVCELFHNSQPPLGPIGSNCHGSSLTVMELIALSRSIKEGLTTSLLLFVAEVLE